MVVKNCTLNFFKKLIVISKWAECISVEKNARRLSSLNSDNG